MVDCSLVRGRFRVRVSGINRHALAKSIIVSSMSVESPLKKNANHAILVCKLTKTGINKAIS